MQRLAAAALAGLLCHAAVPAAACEPHSAGAEYQRIEGKRYVLAWRAVPKIHVGEFFTLDVLLCSREGQPRISTLRVDAQMPEHRHGMNYRPSVRPRGPGRFFVEGLLLHMPGRWEFTFDVNVGAAGESLQVSVEVD